MKEPLRRVVPPRMPGPQTIVVAAALAFSLAAASAPAAGRDGSSEEGRPADRQESAAPEPAAPAGPKPGGTDSDSEAFAKKADAIIDDRNFDARSTPRFQVKTDDPRLDVAEAVGLLESFRSFFDEVWTPRITLKPHEAVSRIYLFYSLNKYRQLLTEVERKGLSESIGHYRPSADIVVIHTDSTIRGDLADVIVHEAAHQIVQRALFGDAEIRSTWLTEGLACYFGHTYREASGRFLAGEIGGKNSALIKDAPRITPVEGPGRLRDYKKALKAGLAEPIDDLIYLPAPEIYQEGSLERYTAAWLLVHYLLHGDGGGRAAGFVRYLEHEARGEGKPEVLYSDIGMSAEDLQSAFKAHVLRLKTR